MTVQYIYANGRMILNPEYSAAPTPNQVPYSVANPDRAIVYPSKLDEANDAVTATSQPIPVSTATTFMQMQSPVYTGAFGPAAQVQGGPLLDSLSTVFAQYRLPIGVVSKLVALQGYALHFKLDDSGSMDGSRWQSLEQRLHKLIDIIKLVPTGPVTFSFLNRQNVIKLDRCDQTPEQFAVAAHYQIREAFKTRPTGGTPICRNVQQMLRGSYRKTAFYLMTDGVPNGYGTELEDRENEIRDVTNLILNRPNPQDNPFTFLCCSDNHRDTEWMHEIEEIACKPGQPGFVAAQQNFIQERKEVLNDQGPEFPYSEGMWLLCNLVAAMNPNDLDAIDQHEPLTKPTMDSLLGRTLTEVEYRSYFNQHPNARWLFSEDYNAFLTTPVANQIQSVALFQRTLADRLAMDINQDDDNSEEREIGYTEEVVLDQLGRVRPQDIRQARRNFWQNHCSRMEDTQPQAAQQDIWGDFVALARLGDSWSAFIQQQQQQQQPQIVGADQPPAYSAVADQPPAYAVLAPKPFTPPQYYNMYSPPISYPQYVAYTVPQSQYYGGSGGYPGVMFPAQAVPRPAASAPSSVQQFNYGDDPGSRQNTKGNCCCTIM